MNFSSGDLLIIIPVILLSMGFHEAIHAYAAHALGDTTAKDLGRLTLNPLAHVDVITTIILPVLLILSHLPPIFIAKPVPFNADRVKYDEFGVALIGTAGPVSNLLIAFLAAMPLRYLELGPLSTKILLYFVIINVSFFVFNMIPIPPLDGSRLLYAFAPEPLQNIMRKIESYGFLVIMAIFIFLLPAISQYINFAGGHIIHYLLPMFS